MKHRLPAAALLLASALLLGGRDPARGIRPAGGDAHPGAG